MVTFWRAGNLIKHISAVLMIVLALRSTQCILADLLIFIRIRLVRSEAYMRKTGDAGDIFPCQFFGFSAKFLAENAILGDFKQF